MKKLLSTALAAAVAATALSFAAPAFAQTQAGGSASATPETCSALQGTGRAFAQTRINYDNDIITNAQTITVGKVRRIAERLLTPVVNNNIAPKRRINTILKNRAMFRQFYGTPGMFLTVILRSARDYMFVQGGPFPFEVRPFGRIDEDGYQLNEDMSGYIKNTMCFEIWKGGTDHVATYRYQVKIDVAKCGFNIIERAQDLTWPGSYIEASLAGVPTKYKYKLQAVALGRFSSAQYDGSTCTPDDPTAPVMTISEVKVDTGNGTLRDLPAGPNNDIFRQMLVSGCIDIFFENYPPKGSTLDTLNPTYCLGRCRRPLIVNTGA